MLGQMQDWPLRVGAILDHAARYHGGRPVRGRDALGRLAETTWAGIREEALRLAAGLRRLDVTPGTVVGAMAWNTPRHMAAWYGVPGAGAVLHALNPRLSAEQLAYIIRHAGDAVILVDPDLVGVLEPLAPALPGVRAYIVLADPADMPETTLPNALCYAD